MPIQDYSFMSYRPPSPLRAIIARNAEARRLKMLAIRPAQMPDQPPDALLIPDDHTQTVDAASRAYEYHAQFGPVMGINFQAGERLFIRLAQSAPGGTKYNFVTKSPLDTILFPVNHDRYPRGERYGWLDRGDGVLYGYLTQEALWSDQVASYASVYPGMSGIR